MADKLSYIPNDDTQNHSFCRLQLVVETFGYSTYEPTNQNSIKVPKVVKPTNKKTLLKDFGDKCNQQLNVQDIDRGDNGVFITLVSKVLW